MSAEGAAATEAVPRSAGPGHAGGWAALSRPETTFLLTNDDGWDAPDWPPYGRRPKDWVGAGWWPRSARSRGAGTA